MLLLALIVMLSAWQLRRLLRACRRANRVDWGRPWLNLLDGLVRLYCWKFHRMRPIRLDLPKAGAAVLVANHVSGLDPLLLIAASGRPLRFLIAREQYTRFGLTWLFRAVGCIPVDRKRRPERALRLAIQALKKGEVVALFPHGGIHLDTDRPRKLKPGGVRLAMTAHCPLLPVHIAGVGLQGHVFLSLFVRSRVRLSRFAPLEHANRHIRQILDDLAEILDGRRPDH